jgi:TRAP-type C4-dicarboxylate transport system substrate-binding protein
MFDLRLLRITVLALVMTLTGGAAAQAVVLKIATLSPDGSSWMVKMREGAAKVAEATQNRVQFKFYPGGVMGNDQAVLRKIRIGQLQGGAFSGGTLSGYYPDAQIYGLPLKFRSLDEVYYVRQQMDALIMEGLEKSGFVSFGLADGGFSYIMSNQPVEKVDALKQLKVWIPSHDRMIMQAMQGFDIDPISLPIADVRTGLQTGLIDTVAISPVGAIVLQWHTQVKYLTHLPMVYVYGILAVERKAFARIGAQDQPLVRTIMEAAWREMDAMNRADNISALKAIRNQGIQFVEPQAQVRAAWYDLAEAVDQEIVDKGYFSPEMIDQLERHLEAYRSRRTQKP